jgi:hypothetical protein
MRITTLSGWFCLPDNYSQRGVPMESAADMAKRHGLEKYLDKPAELNDAIFNLMLLQETVQIEQAQRLKIRPAGTETILSKRSVHGKFIAGCTGDKQYGYAVETALRAATTVVAVFQRGLFISMLERMGIPEDRISQYCDSVIISDDTHCSDRD